MSQIENTRIYEATISLRDNMDTLSEAIDNLELHMDQLLRPIPDVNDICADDTIKDVNGVDVSLTEGMLMAMMQRVSALSSRINSLYCRLL